MLESFPVALAVGTVLGFLSGLGTGGGSLLMLWLTAVLGMPQQTAGGVNLLFFLPAALVACLLRRKQGTLRLRRVLPAVVGGCCAAFAFSRLGTHMDTRILRRLFGVLLLLTGFREVTYKGKDSPRQR